MPQKSCSTLDLLPHKSSSSLDPMPQESCLNLMPQNSCTPLELLPQKYLQLLWSNPTEIMQPPWSDAWCCRNSADPFIWNCRNAAAASCLNLELQKLLCCLRNSAALFWNDICCRLIEILWSPETMIHVLTDEQNKFRRDLYTYDINYLRLFSSHDANCNVVCLFHFSFIMS